MSHTTKTVNGIDVTTWDHATNPMAVKSDARSLAGRLPRGGVIDGEDGKIDRIDGPAYSGGEMKVWLKGQVIQWEAPEGYTIKSVSGFEMELTCITIERE